MIMIGRTVRDDVDGVLGTVVYYNPETMRLDVEWEHCFESYDYKYNKKGHYYSSKKLSLKLFHIYDSGFSFV